MGLDELLTLYSSLVTGTAFAILAGVMVVSGRTRKTDPDYEPAETRAWLEVIVALAVECFIVALTAFAWGHRMMWVVIVLIALCGALTFIIAILVGRSWGRLPHKLIKHLTTPPKSSQGPSMSLTQLPLQRRPGA